MISGTLKHEMQHFDETMGQYIALSRRTPAEVVAQKGGQIIMGNVSPPFPGLYFKLRELSPSNREVEDDVLRPLRAAGRDSKRPVKVRRRARRRAEDLLSGRPSGLFSLRHTDRGKLIVRQVRFRKRGDRRITNRSNRGGVVRISRRSEASGNERLLNVISLGIALEIAYRQAGIGYTAISFLPKKYRKMMGRARAQTRRNAQAYRARKVEMNKALQEQPQAMREDTVMRNASGDVLGRVAFSTNADGNGASLRVTGFTPPQKRGAAHEMVADVLRHVSADTMVYIDKKLEKTRGQVGRFGKN